MSLRLAGVAALAAAAVLSVHLGAGRVLMWGTVHAKGRGSGAEINVPTAGVIELEDGLIRRWRDVGDRERALEEAGGAR